MVTTTLANRTKFIQLAMVGIASTGLLITVLHRAAVTMPHMHDQMHMIEPGPGAFLPAIAPLNRTGWTAVASDSYKTNPASYILDGDTNTFWHSNWSKGTPYPHTLTIDMQAMYSINGLTYLPRQDGTPNGNIGQFTIQTSLDNATYSSPLATGTWADNSLLKTIPFVTTNARYVRLTMLSEAGGREPWASAAEINLLSGQDTPQTSSLGSWSPTIGFPLVPTAAVLLPNNKLLTFSANATTSFAHGSTIWHSDYENNVPFPHSITVDMQSSKTVAGLSYLPRQDGSLNGNIGKYTIYTSTDGKNFSNQVASGTWVDNANLKTVKFGSVKARYVRLKATSEAGKRGPWSSASEINILDASAKPLPRNGWTASASDTNGDDYASNVLDDNIVKTKFSIMDLATNTVSAAANSTSNHEMFCSGLSLLADGRLLVIGGSSDGKTTIYNPADNTWTAGPELNTPRAYEGAVTLSNGQVMTVGGSWNSEDFSKNGELYTPAANGGTWKNLPGVLADSIMTADPEGMFRADNHAWLFAQSGGTVFHAGPSKQMNWMTTAGNGTTKSAGLRADSPDSMNGNAVMYDVGKILVVGGAPAYEDSDATNRAYKIDITGGPTQPVVTTRLPNMAYARAFNNSTVLPDGEVLVVGGQAHAQPFTDTGAVLTPELWDPTTGLFTVMAAASVPRTYHSVALLLPDGRVFSGGGGLCGDDCTTNHLDGQIFTPPYLLNTDGSLRSRPTLTSSPATAKLGTAITVTTGNPVSKFVLIRTSSVTHSLNTDQRRIPLTINSTSANNYSLAVPSDAGTVIPGEYLLFALDANGTPSTAKYIVISAS